MATTLNNPDTLDNHNSRHAFQHHDHLQTSYADAREQLLRLQAENQAIQAQLAEVREQHRLARLLLIDAGDRLRDVCPEYYNG